MLEVLVFWKVVGVFFIDYYNENGEVFYFYVFFLKGKEFVNDLVIVDFMKIWDLSFVDEFMDFLILSNEDFFLGWVII